VKKNETIGKMVITKSSGLSFPWVVVILGALVLLSAYVHNYTFGVFFKPIAEQFGWNRATISGAIAFRALVAAALVVPMGYWADHYHPRRVLLPCIILLGVSMMAIAKINNIWQLYLIQGLGIGIGMSAPFVCVMSTIVKWHDTRRGLALGIASAGTGLGSIIFPPVATKLIEVKGWPFATFILGVIVLAIGIPASLMIKDPPKVMKQQLTDSGISSKSIFSAWYSISQFFRTPVFLAIIVMFLFTGTVGNMLTNHLVNYATDIGITALLAAGMISVMGVSITIGKFGIGAISDRIGTKRSTLICCVSLVASSILLISRIPLLMWVGTALSGIGFGGSLTLGPIIMGERVSIDKISAATGANTMGGWIGSALGPWLGGILFDISDSYTWALLLAMGVSFVALIIALRMPPSKLNIILKK
jgi:MFS family permease